MADKYDKMLEKFFTGGLDLEIKMREEELRHPQLAIDENIGGSRAQNKRSYSVENTMVKIESDETLNKLKEQRRAIVETIKTFDREHNEVVSQHYRQRISWDMIATLHFTDRRTVIRWRDEFKDYLLSWNRSIFD
ncbi:DUF722 domain-containing protein [Weissella minor]|uniref:DUF722 domain-containing protein n=1 Tax=Weissella minor TaxID=1620 RepID=UPI0007096FEF|nr:DUF722 domain-containing protein [Weissella minor]